MSILPEQPDLLSLPVDGQRTKFCFVYCGPDRCNCMPHTVHEIVLKQPLEVVTNQCGICHKCLEGHTTEQGLPITMMRMILCPTCGNKRCPHATDHNLDCTNSNDAGQKGSVYE